MPMLALHDAHCKPPSPLPAEVLDTDRRLGPWQLIRPLQTGPCLHVFQARPVECSGAHRGDYVLKFTPPDQPPDAIGKCLIQREAFVSRQVSHPHLTTVLSAQTDRPPFYLVLPYLSGASGRRLLERYGRLVTPQALWIVRQTAEALQTLHAAGWLHADVKPSNVLFSPRGHATLIDLGFARRIDRHTAPSTLMTSLAYASPELIRQDGTLDGRSDVYSLGVTLFELLTGRLPFLEQDPHALADAQLNQSPPEPRRLVPGLSPRVSRLVLRMLDKTPSRRPTADELMPRLMDLEIETFDERVAA